MTLTLGKTNTGISLGLDIEQLLRSRLLVQASSGGGKSSLMRLIAEHTGNTQFFVLDPEGNHCWPNESSTYHFMQYEDLLAAFAEIDRLKASRASAIRECRAIVEKQRPSGIYTDRDQLRDDTLANVLTEFDSLLEKEQHG